MSVLCRPLMCNVQVFGRRDDEAIHADLRPASEKRQGTKLREVGAAEQRALWGFCRELGLEKAGAERLRRTVFRQAWARASV